MATISTTASDSDRELIARLVQKEPPGDWTVFMDGRVIGRTSQAERLVAKIKEKRRAGLINQHISVGYDPIFEEVQINTDSGRLMRPLIIVQNKKPLLTEEILARVHAGEIGWKDLLNQGIIEYLDAEEEDNSLVALNSEEIQPDTTHMEIDPVCILGLSASLVPFAPHNRGDRVNFGAKMSGQSLGIYVNNFLSRTDTKADVLVYPQVPLVSTLTGRDLEILQGQNVVLAVMSWNGYNMDDALIFNRAAIERGLGRSFFLRTYTTEEKRYFGIERDEIRIPDKSVSGYRTEEAYAELGPDGIINRERAVKSGDVLVGRVSPLRFFGPAESLTLGVESRRETSETVRYGEDGIVDNVLMTETATGDRIVKVVLRSERSPEIGDKFASRHGQKGVIGIIVPEQDMPFTADGIVPDVIINTHAIPSRMTIGQILEIIGGKLSALSGVPIDGTAFSESADENAIREALIRAGWRDDGKETMYNGTTGELLQGRILIGPCYMQKLHHMVANKIHARGRGPVTLLTKQPTAGRSKQGGLRLGEMEKDCLLSHGAAILLKERFGSDRAKIPVCQSCGMVAIDDRIHGKVVCPVCKKSTIVDIEISYAFKLMLDELKCMGIYPKIVAE
jgi:DNA-directed RNA polymerase subunit B'